MKRPKTTVYKTHKQLIKSAIRKAVDRKPIETDPNVNLDFLQQTARKVRGL